MQKALRSLPPNRVMVHLIPEHVINYMENDPASTNQLESFCVNLYNRIIVPIDQPLARKFSPDNTPISVKAYLQKPIFTLARPTYNKVTYTRSAPSSLGVLDRYTLLHVGYRISACGKWVTATCVDQRGEAWDQSVWLVKNDHQDTDGEGSATGSGVTAGSAPGGNDEAFVVRKVWDFAAAFASKADVEWRIVISKLGIMEETEFTGIFSFSSSLSLLNSLPAWTTLLPAVLAMDYSHSVHVSLVCADPDSPWLFTKLSTNTPLQQQSSSNKSSNSKQMVFSDISSTTYAVFSSVVLPIAVPPSQSDMGISLPYVADPSSVNYGLGDGDAEATATSPASTTITTATAIPTSPSSPASPTATSPGSIPHAVGLLPKATSCLIRIPCSAPLTSASMLHIHLLSTYCSPASSAAKSNALELKTVHADITKNFYELSVLAQSQWKMWAPEAGNINGGTGSGNGDSSTKTGVNPILPVHLAMVDIMSQVTDGADGAEIDS